MVLDRLWKEHKAHTVADTEKRESAWKSGVPQLRPGDTDLLGEEPSMLVLHCPVLGKHIIKLLNDLGPMEKPERKKEHETRTHCPWGRSKPWGQSPSCLAWRSAPTFPS